MESARRLFVGLRPPPEIAELLHARSREALGATRGKSLRLVAAHDVHLTLCFLGRVLEAHLAGLDRALERELRGAHELDLVVTATGAFPGPGRERVLWAGVEELAAARGSFDRLRHAVVRAVQEAGLQPDRHAVEEGFTAHLSLARIRGKTRVAEEFHALRFAVPWRVREVHLFESDLGSEALVRYPILRTYALGAQPGDAR